MRILLIRHGAMMDTGGITGGNADPKLTKEGAAQAQKLGSFLKENHPDIFPTVISSHQIRSYKTAKKAFPKEFHIIPTRKLREVDHAGTEGKDPAVRNREWAEFEDAKVASGEAADDPYYLWKNTPYAEERAETLSHLDKRTTAEILKYAKDLKAQGAEKVAFVVHNAIITTQVMKSKIASGELEPNRNGLYPMFFQFTKLLGHCTVAVFECDPDAEDPQLKFIGFENEKT